MADTRDDSDTDRAPAEAGAEADSGAAAPLKPFSRRPSRPTPTPTPSPSRAFRPEPARRLDRRPGEAMNKQLIVGREIELKGEITSCDRLVVEGRVEASLSDARVIEVAASGYFRGAANVDEADISGQFEGELVARDKLTVRAQGRVSGTIRYGKIIIESGGEIAGETRSLNQADEAVPANRPQHRALPEEG